MNVCQGVPSSVFYEIRGLSWFYELMKENILCSWPWVFVSLVLECLFFRILSVNHITFSVYFPHIETDIFNKHLFCSPLLGVFPGAVEADTKGTKGWGGGGEWRRRRRRQSGAEKVAVSASSEMSPGRAKWQQQQQQRGSVLLRGFWSLSFLLL